MKIFNNSRVVYKFNLKMGAIKTIFFAIVANLALFPPSKQ